jgi:hypothetical protein
MGCGEGTVRYWMSFLVQIGPDHVWSARVSGTVDGGDEVAE